MKVVATALILVGLVASPVRAHLQLPVVEQCEFTVMSTTNYQYIENDATVWIKLKVQNSNSISVSATILVQMGTQYIDYFEIHASRQTILRDIEPGSNKFEGKLTVYGVPRHGDVCRVGVKW